MYCVIQEIETKKTNPYGAYKELEAYKLDWTINGQPNKYLYHYTGERFERPIRKAYKISIHKSYREDGRVKKKQWSICTMGYYELIEWSLYDFIIESKLQNQLKEMDISEDEFYKLVYKKLDPLIEKVTKEFQQTEEYKISQEHKKIIDKYNRVKEDFESKYGQDTYDYCYDVFGNLRNEEMLNNIKLQYENRKEYERSYYENYESNYNYDSFSSYQGIKQSNYTDDEKAYLKIIYKAAAMKLHPDIKKDNGEGMKFLNRLKDEWGL